MTESADDRLQEVFRATGLVTPYGDAAGLRRSYDERSLRLEPAFSERGNLAADAVFETANGPALIVKRADESEIDRVRERAWNLGLAPLLWIVTPQEVRLYDAFKGRTADDDLLGTYSVSLCEEMARLNDECGRYSLETGAFWDSELGRNFSRAGKVDRVLLEEIKALEDRLVKVVAPGNDPSVKKSARNVAQELVTCTLFASFLLERGIARPDGVTDLVQAFASERSASDLLNWLTRTFNGDVFPAGLSARVRPEHLLPLADFVAGRSLLPGQEGQGSLFRFRFDTIPIELISAIYESFARRAAAVKAKSLSLHYTPVNLVHLAADPALDGLDRHAKVLDMACGSGLFLVHALRRLAFKQRGDDGTVTREVVRGILYRQIHGIDTSEAALKVACFSLYLAALELEPLGVSPQKFEGLIGKSLLSLDAVSDAGLSAMKRIGPDVIVGNPPWTHKKGSKSQTDARRSPDQTFLRKAMEIMGRTGRVSMYMKGSSFMSPDVRATNFRKYVVTNLDRLAILNFSALRNENLFSGAQSPAILICANCGHLPEKDEVLVGTFPWSKEFARTGALTMLSSTVAHIEKARVIATPEVLKAAMFGVPRDVRLIERMTKLTTLNTLLKSAGVKSGQGFQVKGRPKLISETIAKLPSMFPRDYVAITTDELTLPTLEERGYTTLHFQRSPDIYRAPVLIVPKSAHRKALAYGRISAAISTRDIAYSHGFYGFSFSNADPRLAAVLCVILNSAVASWQMLFGPGSIGMERPSFQLQDLRGFRVPELTMTDELAEEARQALASANVGEFAPMDDFAVRLFGFGTGEKRLVMDGVQRAIPWLLDDAESRLSEVDKPSQGQLDAYSQAVCETVNAMLRLSTKGRRLRAVVGTEGPSALQNFRAVAFTIDGQGDVSDLPKPSQVLASVASHLDVSHTPYLIERRSLRIYAPSHVTVIKPAEARAWSIAAGMEDGDAILVDHWRHDR